MNNENDPVPPNEIITLTYSILTGIQTHKYTEWLPYISKFDTFLIQIEKHIKST